MTVVARNFVARPVRTSGETWAAITKLVCGSDHDAAGEFLKVSGVASSLIEDDMLEDDPFIVIGSKGPRLRVYCLYGERAVSADEQNESTLSWSPTEGGWMGYLPCSSEDLEWVTRTLSKTSSKFKAYDVDEGISGGIGDDTSTENSQSSGTGLTINAEGFMKL
jgi:hypothetical protein